MVERDVVTLLAIGLLRPMPRFCRAGRPIKLADADPIHLACARTASASDGEVAHPSECSPPQMKLGRYPAASKLVAPRCSEYDPSGDQLAGGG